MSFAVLIPYRGCCPHRERARKWVRERYEAQGVTVAVGHHDEGPFRKAVAVAQALQQTDHEVIAVCDADVWCEGLREAVQAVQNGHGWAIPHRGVFRLTEAATGRCMAGEPPQEPPQGLPLAERAYLGVEGGGIVVLRRETYESVPLDPRYAGWGSEDEAWGWALRTLVGPPWRGKAPLAHLWHPPPPRMSRSRGSQANTDLRARYARALRNPDAMRAIVEEVTATCP